LWWYLRGAKGRTRRWIRGQSKRCSVWASSLVSVFKSVFLLILTYGHECREMTERILSQVQAAEMRFLRRVHGVILHDKVRSCGIRQDLNVMLLLQIESLSGSTRCPNVPGKTGEASPAGYTHGKAAQRSSKDQVEWLHLQPCLVPSWCGATSWCGANRTIWNCWKILRYFEPSWDCCPRNSPQRKGALGNEWMKLPPQTW